MSAQPASQPAHENRTNGIPTGNSPAGSGPAHGLAKASGRQQVSRVIAIVCGIAAVVLLVLAIVDPFSKGSTAGPEHDDSYVSYPAFMTLVGAGKVESAEIASDRVTFTARVTEGADAACVASVSAGVSAGTEEIDTPATAGAPAGGEVLVTRHTDNPGSDDFKERLLMAGVQVSEATDAGSILNFVLDLLLYAIFLGGIGFAISRWVNFSHGTFKVVRNTGVTFDDIAGMQDLKRELKRAVSILTNREEFARKGIRQTKGIILEGPPGNGKTLVAKAIAQEAGVRFIATKGADFQSAFMSLGARKIRALFKKARRHTPCIVFIDEFDSIGERRNYAGTGIDKENNRIITAMLNEMDGFEPHDGVLVIAATNSYRSLDPALIRPGRFDLKFTVGNPDRETRIELVRLYTRGKQLAPDATPEILAGTFDGLSCAAIETVLNEAFALAAFEAEGAGGAGATGTNPSAPVGMATIRRAATKVDVRLA